MINRRIHLGPYVIVNNKKTVITTNVMKRMCSNTSCLREWRDITVNFCPLCGSKINIDFSPVDTVIDGNVSRLLDATFPVDTFYSTEWESKNNEKQYIIFPNTAQDSFQSNIGNSYTTSFELDFGGINYDMMLDRYFKRSKNWKKLCEILKLEGYGFTMNFGLVQYFF